ncbi:MAG: hypothetical protein U1D30_26440 [Planctomycetota bacterium]
MSLLWAKSGMTPENLARARIRGPEGYTLTALTSLAVLEKVLADQVKPGFQTPSLMYGPDFILEIPGVTREDLP